MFTFMQAEKKIKRHYYLIVDTETTQANTVADFGAVIVNRQGDIIEQFGCMVSGQFGKVELFSDPTAHADAFWSQQSAQRRAKDYYAMIESGQRSIASPALINLWLARVKAQYQPILTAYNIGFDVGKCRNTGINLGIFAQRFCLMKAAKNHFGVLADYHKFCEDNGLVTAKMRRPSMTADTMTKFLLQDASYVDEPHTALEDARDYEAPILTSLLKTLSRKQLLAIG